MGKMDFPKALTRGWQIFTKDPLNLILGGVIVGLISMTVILAPIMIAGYVYLVLRVARGEKAELGDIFNGFSDFGRYFLGGLVYVLVMLVPMLLAIASSGLGVVLQALAGGIVILFWPLMVAKKMSGPDAFKGSLDVWKREYLAATILTLLFIAMGFISGLTFGLGYIIAMPLMFTITIAAYEQVFGLAVEIESEDVREGSFEEVTPEAPAPEAPAPEAKKPEAPEKPEDTV